MDVAPGPPPSADELAAVAALCGRGARTVRTRRLRGGITSVVHQVTVERRDGARTSLVVRRVPWDDRTEAAAAVARDAAILDLVAGSGVPAAELVHAAPDGLVAGAAPATVMRRAPGRVDLRPADMARWLDELVTAAVAIHQLPLTSPTAFQPWTRSELLRVPDGAARGDIWSAAHEAVRAGPPASTGTTFIHRDYQHFNLLWRRGRISAVLDWNEATNGPAAIDVGHCRLNLAVLFSADVAEDFLRRYQRESATTVDPWWDLQELVVFGEDWPSFIPVQVAGRAPVDVSGMVGRVERVIEAALRRLG